MPAARVALLACLLSLAVALPAAADTLDTRAPSAPPGLRSTAAATSVTFSWGAARDNVGVTGYLVYLRDPSGTWPAAPSLTLPADARAATFTGLTSSTPVAAAVAAVDAAGNVSTRATRATTTTPATYYVSPTGNDTASGLSPATAWQTVARVNAAPLRPRDTVLFAGGQTFSDATLMPSISGTPAAHITYGSYGAGRATLAKGVWLYGVSSLTIQNLAMSGTRQAVSASASGPGVSDLLVQGLAIANVSIGVNSANAADRHWTIRNSTITQTGDSGIIVLGDDFQITGNTILDTGTDPSIAYPKHGIYLKAADAHVSANTIRRFEADGVSARFRNSLIERNTISDGPIGIAWFQDDPVAGRSTWRSNTITGTTAADIYVSPSDAAGPTTESFAITGNTLAKAAGNYLDLQPTSGAYAVAGNRLR